MKNKPILIFDFDGTIADTLPAITEILQKFSKKYHFETVSKERLLEFRDYSLPEILKINHIPAWKVPLMLKDGREELRKSITHFVPITGMTEALMQLKEFGYELAIISSNSQQNVEVFLEENNLALFKYVFTGSSLFGKARVIRSFLKKYQILSTDVFYIGDEVRDVQAAQQVGIKVVAVSWGLNSKKALKKAKPDFMIDAPLELIKIFTELAR